MTKLRPTTTVS